MLILTICSFRKRRGGCRYSADGAVISRLGDGHKLVARRAKVLSWLQSDPKSRFQGLPLHRVTYNRGLRCGPDFGGEEEAGEYLPAVERYDGRLYRALGDEGKLALLCTRHHVLILSGLYGLVTPEESIQLYSCPVIPSAASATLWTNLPPTLTDLLVHYIREHSLTRVWDLTANRTYRRLVNWKQLAKAIGKGAQVLHCFSATAAGDNALPAFGDLLRDHLLREPEPAAIEPDVPRDLGQERVVFSSTPEPPHDWPREQYLAVRDLADEVDRNRRGVVRYLQLKGIPDPHSLGAWIEVAAPYGVPHEVVGWMRTVNELRNKLIYKGVPLGKAFGRFRSACERLRAQARSEGHQIEEFDTDWDSIAGPPT